MRLTIAEPRLLKESINIISELVNEVTFKVDTNKIEIVAMDPANVAMVIFKLLSSSFIEYQVEKPVAIAINLDSLKNVLRRAKQTDAITLELKDNKLKVEIKGESIRTFHLALIDIEEREQKIPDLKFPLKVEMPTMLFDEAIEDMDIISDSVALISEKDRIIIQSQSKLNSAKVEITTDEETVIEKEDDEKVKSKYSTEYLKKIIKGSKLSNNVNLYFDNDYPLKVEYKVMDKLLLTFILAPRVAND